MCKIIDILQDIRPEFDFTDSINFFEDGYIDSFDLISLVVALDKEFKIKIKGTDIVPENFRNFDAIESLLRKYGVKDEI